MSVQLILFPQYFDGTNPLNTNITQFVPDGKIFSSVNNTSALTSVATPVVQTAINTASVPLNTYYRFSGNANSVVQASNNLVFVADTGIILRLSNLVVGVSYDVDINFLSQQVFILFNTQVYYFKVVLYLQLLQEYKQYRLQLTQHQIK